MIYYGNGGFNFDDLYTMPVYLRNFYLKLMVDTKKKEQEEQEKANKGQDAPSSKQQPYGPAVSRIPKG